MVANKAEDTEHGPTGRTTTIIQTTAQGIRRANKPLATLSKLRNPKGQGLEQGVVEQPAAGWRLRRVVSYGY